ncbi:hypothetical protein BJX70DRAFT_147216 [Aspergillus crustosus]
MKTTFAAIGLSLIGTTLAAPAAAAAPETTPTPNPYPVSISNISLKHLIESDGYDFTFHATSRTPYGEPIESVYCHTAWNNNGPYPDTTTPEACAFIYSFFFPGGVANTESFTLTVRDEAGVEASAPIEQGPKYLCGPYQGEIGNIDTECRSTNGGEFYLKV